MTAAGNSTSLKAGRSQSPILGVYGTRSLLAIINPPHARILAVGTEQRRPVVEEDGTLSVGTVMSVALSADYRVLDGALAAERLAALVAHIESLLSILVCHNTALSEHLGRDASTAGTIGWNGELTFGGSPQRAIAARAGSCASAPHSAVASSIES